MIVLETMQDYLEYAYVTSLGMQASFELELQVGVQRSCGEAVYLAKIVDMWHIDAHENAHSLLANAPSNKPLE